MLFPGLLLALLISGRAVAPPAFEPHPNINAAYDLPADGADTQFLRRVATTPTLAACAAAAWQWANASAPAEQCQSIAWLRAPANATLLNACICLLLPKWIPITSAQADSARLLRPCAGDGDCSLNGACLPSGACACDAGWRGLRCGELALGAVDRAAPGLRLTKNYANVSTWGARFLQDAEGLWHAWASEMTGGCGLDSWTTNSQIVHATAAAPGGPWARREVVAAVFAHEPDVVRGPAGELVMAFAAAAVNGSGCGNCSQGSTGAAPDRHHTGCGPSAGHGFTQMIMVAPGFDAPWGAAVEIPQLSRPWDWNLCLYIFQNNSALGLIRAGMTWGAGDYRAAASWAPVNGGARLPGNDNVEDPAVWLGPRGFHALFHAMDGGPAYCGAHAFSEDGVAWTSSGWAYGNAVNFTDGGSFSFSRRERPHPVIDANGTLLGISTGAQFGGPFGDATFTLFQPVEQSGVA